MTLVRAGRAAASGGAASAATSARAGRLWMAGALFGSAAFAAGVAAFSDVSLHRSWGLVAACAYLAAGVAVLSWPSHGRDLALLLSVGGALVTPLLLNTTSGQAQDEVTVVARSAWLLVHGQSPYPLAGQLVAAHYPGGYNPYLPAMSAFGVPQALLGPGPLTDPRVWFVLVSVLAFGLALRAAGARNVIRWTALVAASPLIAFELCVGGTDVPVVALMCLGLALLRRQPRPVLAGLVLGVAAAAKATAWPALAIVVVMMTARSGWQRAAAMLGAAAGACAALAGPVAWHWPAGLVANTVAFPLGLASTKSAAASPLPGHLIASTGPAGRVIALALLVAAGVTACAWLAAAPPRTVPAATGRLAAVLLALFTLAPQTRFGYYIYPAVLVAWLGISQVASRAPAGHDEVLVASEELSLHSEAGGLHERAQDGSLTSPDTAVLGHGVDRAGRNDQLRWDPHEHLVRGSVLAGDDWHQLEQERYVVARLVGPLRQCGPPGADVEVGHD